MKKSSQKIFPLNPQKIKKLTHFPLTYHNLFLYL